MIWCSSEHNVYLHVSDIVLNNTSIGAEHLHNFLWEIKWGIDNLLQHNVFQTEAYNEHLKFSVRNASFMWVVSSLILDK